MLRVENIKNEDKENKWYTNTISRILDGDKVLSEFDPGKGVIDLEPARPYIGQKILMQYDYPEDRARNTEKFMVLTGIGPIDDASDLNALYLENAKE